jgi:hypothetical protein
MKLDALRRIWSVALLGAVIGGCGDSQHIPEIRKMRESESVPLSDISINHIVRGEWTLHAVDERQIGPDEMVTLTVGKSECDGAVHAQVDHNSVMNLLDEPPGCFVECLRPAAKHHAMVRSALRAGAPFEIKKSEGLEQELIFHELTEGRP